MCCHIQGAEDLIAISRRSSASTPARPPPTACSRCERVECLAACGNGPAILINDEFLYGPDGSTSTKKAGTRPADIDAGSSAARKEAAANPEPDKVDALGGIMLDTKGIPGARVPAPCCQPTTRRRRRPLKVKARSAGEAITVAALCAPETTDTAIVERSAMTAPGRIGHDRRQGVPCPARPVVRKTLPRRPLAVGEARNYRVVAKEGERAARASAPCRSGRHRTHEPDAGKTRRRWPSRGMPNGMGEDLPQGPQRPVRRRERPQLDVAKQHGAYRTIDKPCSTRASSN